MITQEHRAPSAVRESTCPPPRHKRNATNLQRYTTPGGAIRRGFFRFPHLIACIRMDDAFLAHLRCPLDPAREADPRPRRAAARLLAGAGPLPDQAGLARPRPRRGRAARGLRDVSQLPCRARRADVAERRKSTGCHRRHACYRRRRRYPASRRCLRLARFRPTRLRAVGGIASPISGWSRARVVAVASSLVRWPRVRRAAAEPPPPHLPRYDLDLTIDTAKHTARLRERVTWTNTTKTGRQPPRLQLLPALPRPRRATTSSSPRRSNCSASSRRSASTAAAGTASSRRRGSSRSAASRPTRCCRTSSTTTTRPRCGSRCRRRSSPGESVTVELGLRVPPAEQAGPLGPLGGRDVPDELAARCSRSATTPAGGRCRSSRGTSRGSTRPASSRATITLPAERDARVPGRDRSPKRSSATAASGSRREPFVGRDFAVLCSARASRSSRGDDEAARRPRRSRCRCLAFPEHEFYATRDPEDRRRGDPGLLAVVRAVTRTTQFTVVGVVLRVERQRVRRPRHDRRARLRHAAPGPRVRRVPRLARDLPPVVVQPRRHERLRRDVHGRGRGDVLHAPAARPEARQEQRLPGLAEGADVAAEHQPRQLPLRRHVLRDPQRRDAPGGAGPAASTTTSSACSPGPTTAGRRCSA